MFDPAKTTRLENESRGEQDGMRRPRPEDDVVPRRPRPEDDVVVRRPRPEDDIVPGGDKPILDVRGLTKSYGTTLALNELSFKLYPGDILGFLGPNGAGKTTTLRILATVLAPNAGEAFIDGYSLREVEEVRARVGYMPDFLGVYDDLLVREYLEFFARAYKISAHHREFVIKEALETTRLTKLADNPVDGLSRGQKQRLGLARLLMHDPALLLLDEPAAGLDPRARVELRDILRGLQKRGKAMIVSSHILSDLADFCNKVAILVKGNLITLKLTHELLDGLNETRRIRLKLLEGGEEARKYLESLPSVTSPQWDGRELVFEFTGHNQELAALHHDLFEEGFPLVTFAEEPWDLQDAYLRLTEGMETD